MWNVCCTEEYCINTVSQWLYFVKQLQILLCRWFGISNQLDQNFFSISMSHRWIASKRLWPILNQRCFKIISPSDVMLCQLVCCAITRVQSPETCSNVEDIDIWAKTVPDFSFKKLSYDRVFRIHILWKIYQCSTVTSQFLYVIFCWAWITDRSRRRDLTKINEHRINLTGLTKNHIEYFVAFRMFQKFREKYRKEWHLLYQS